MAKVSGNKKKRFKRKSFEASASKKGLRKPKAASKAKKPADDPVKELREVVPGYEHQRIEYSPEESPVEEKRPGIDVSERKTRNNYLNPKKAALIALIVVAAAIIIFFLLAKLRFILNDELDLEIKPLHQGFSVENNDTITAIISLTNNNFAQCSAECNLYLKDISTGETIYSDSKIIRHKETLEEEFNIEMPGKGTGQRIYLFEADCRNIKTVVCLTDEESRHESATITADYSLTEEEQVFISTKRPTIESWLLQVKEIRGLYAQFKKMFTILPDSVGRDGLEAILVASFPEVSMLVDASERVIDSWAYEDYFSAKDYFSQAVIDKADALAGLFRESIQGGVELVDARNSNLELLKQVEAYQKISSELMEHCINESSPENDKRINLLANISRRAIDHHKMLTARSDISEEELGKLIAITLESFEGMKTSYLSLKERTAALIVEGTEMLKQRNPEMNISFGDGCEGLRKLTEEFEKENNSSASGPIEGDEASAGDDELVAASLLNNSANKEQLSAFCKADNHTRDKAFDEAQKTISSFLELGLGALNDFRAGPFPGPVDVGSQTSLADNPPICCAYAKCSPCCIDNSCYDNENHYPVIFIHGHAFNDANNPEYSLSAFSKMQKKMTDEGFISFGELDLETDIEGNEGSWGMMRNPITLRASYYYITHYEVGGYMVNVQKSESIENYALRLREIIELTRKKTGSSKVNIVAHSMGGLVTRQYLELFGYKNVGKVILINTPNHGVSGKIRKLCSVLGARRECSELAEDSIFLKKLNSKTIPEGAKIYSIRSTGCAMDGEEDGDGIVTADSAYLEGAFNYEIKGSCTSSFGTDLHTDVLNPEKYPEMYELVLSILSQ